MYILTDVQINRYIYIYININRFEMQLLWRAGPVAGRPLLSLFKQLL